MIRDMLKDKIIRNIQTLFEAEQEKKERKELEKKKEYNERLIKDGIIRVSGHFLSKKKIIMGLKE